MRGLFLLIKKNLYNLSFIYIERHSREIVAIPFSHLNTMTTFFSSGPMFTYWFNGHFHFPPLQSQCAQLYVLAVGRVGGDHAVSTPLRSFPWISLVSWLVVFDGLVLSWRGAGWVLLTYSC